MKMDISLPKLYKAAIGEGAPQTWEIRVEEIPGGGEIVITHGKEGGKLQEKREKILKGKNPGKKNETTPYQQAVNEAKSRHEKQLSRKGYGLTVEASAGVRGESVMLAQHFEDYAKKVDWPSAFAQPKLDGFRLRAKMVDGQVVLFSRENQPVAGMGHIAEALQKRWANAGTTEFQLDGEAYGHGVPLNSISSGFKKESDKSILMQYHIYDCMALKMPFRERISLVRELVEAIDHPYIQPVETIKVRSEHDLMHAQKRFLEEGFEGAMLRAGLAGYEPGQRSQTLLKAKVWKDEEFKIIDMKKARDGIAVYMCDTKAGHTFEVTAPGTMEEKKAQWAAGAKAHIGKRLTIRFAYFTKTDEPVPFQPVAVAFRE